MEPIKLQGVPIGEYLADVYVYGWREWSVPSATTEVLALMLSDAAEAAICTLLGRSMRPEACEILAEAYDTGEWVVRREACHALGNLKDPRAIPTLAKALQDPSVCVRMAAVQAMGRMTDPQRVPHLLDALHDSDWYVRFMACYHLSRSRLDGALKEQVKDAFTRLAQHDPDVQIREMAARALARL